MLRRVILPAIAIVLVASVSTPAKTKIDRFDPSLLLAMQCKAEAKEVANVWYVNVDRDPPAPPPGQPQKYASGAFDARIPVWVKFKGQGQQFVTVSVGAYEDGARVDSGKVFTGRMITGAKIDDVEPPKKCEAFALPSA
jgi:hypothetical protein